MWAIQSRAQTTSEDSGTACSMRSRWSKCIKEAICRKGLHCLTKGASPGAQVATILEKRKIRTRVVLPDTNAGLKAVPYRRGAGLLREAEKQGAEVKEKSPDATSHADPAEAKQQ